MTTSQKLLGNTFLHPVVDYILIGSLWSILLVGWIMLNPEFSEQISPLSLAVIILFANASHFAASTVRLYSKPNYYRDFPFLTLMLPLITFAILALVITYPGEIGSHLQALYLTWSPYHYAAQTFGLSVMYCYRSGYRLDVLDKRLIRLSCMLPFLRSFLGANSSGLAWFISRESLAQFPWLIQGLGAITDILLVMIFVAPIALFVRANRKKNQSMPLIVISMMVANGLWWTVLDYVNAFVIATIAHSIQYMAIILIFHVREQLESPTNKHGSVFHALKFYVICLLLGYALFYIWPYGFVWMGFGLAESMLLVVAIINIHHFIVDRYIWRLRRPEAVKVMIDSGVEKT